MMTVTLELKPTVEAAAKAEAQAQGMAIENYLQAFLERQLPGQEQLPTKEARREAAQARIQSGYYAHYLSSSEEFAARKTEEKALEERHWSH